MGLRDIDLKEEYRSDKADIVSEFFVPCLSSCVQYDRCIEYVSLKSLTTLALGFDNFASHKARMRMVTGHRFGAGDLDAISRLFGPGSHFGPVAIRDSKVRMLKEMVDNGQLEIKIAIPSSEDVAGSFTEKIGIFTDEAGDSVAFTGTSNETFNSAGTNFESVDVFTSWGDPSRVKTKKDDFALLWENDTRYLDVYSFEDATRHNLTKYSSRWAIRD